MENKKVTMKDDIEIAVMYVLDYCKKHGVYAYNDYMERSFNDSLMKVLDHFYTENPDKRVVTFHKEQHVFKK